MFKKLLLLLSLLPAAASADTFYLEQVRQSTIASSTVERLVKAELATKGHTIVEDENTSQWIINTDAIQLGDSYIVTLTKSRDGKVEYSDKLKSIGLEDLDTVTTRLVSGALDNVSASKSVTVGTVTTNEATGTTKKTRVTRQTYLGFGPSTIANLDTSNAARTFTIGKLWGVDDQFSLRAGFTTSNISDSPADMTSISLGGHYYFNSTKHAHYAVGALGYTWAESHDSEESNSFFRQGESESGWGVEAGVGSHFYRTANVNIAAELTYTQALFEVTDGAPGTLGAKLIVFW